MNWDLIYFRALYQFLSEEGYEVPKVILKLKVLDTPQRLPRPLATEQVRRLGRGIQKTITKAKTEFKWRLTVRNLAYFYLLWHCGLRISEGCSLRLIDIDMDARKLFIHNSEERKNGIAYMSDTAALAVQQHLAIRPDLDSTHLFTTQHGALYPRSLQRRLVHYSRHCGVPVTAQRLRNTFANQMLAVGMPVSSLQRYLGHEHLDTTMIYAEVSDSLLRQDYYQGIAALDNGFESITMSGLKPFHQQNLRQLVEELKTPGLKQFRQDEILDIILAIIS